MIDTYTSLHCHGEYSSAVLRFPDAIGSVKESIQWCYENGLRGYAITDHQTVAGYADLEQAFNKLNVERPFQHIFGNEFYLISEDEDNLRFSENQRPYYWHYLVNVLDEIGLKQMYELSSRAWLRSYTYKGLLRRPSFYSDFEEIVGKDPGHLIASSACLGGYLPKCILNNQPKEANNFIKWNKQVFGDGNFFLECQPCFADNEEQIKVNQTLWQIHQKTNTPIIVTTDAHYLRPETRYIHTAFLKSKDGGDSREPEKFYQTTYLFTPQELRETLYNSSFTDEQIDVLFQTTNDIADRVQPITIKKKTRVPALPSLPQFEVKGYYQNKYDQYPHIKYYAESPNPNEQYYYAQVEKGLKEYQDTHDIDIDKYLKQVDIEMEQVKGLGDIFDGECMADYFTVVQKVVDLIWSEGDSYVGIGRGSAGCYVTNKLLGITGIDPLLPENEEFYPWWRFCSIARSDSIFDIDIDIQSFKKERIIKALKEYFGWRRVCQVVTWGKLSAKTSLERAGKGLGIPDDTINYIKSLIPVKRGAIYSLKDCVEGNPSKGRERVPEFVNEVNKYPGLLETAMAFEGMIVSSGVHAGALNILKGDFTETGSLMVSANGAVVSQFDLHQAEYSGDLKMDLLSIDALECLRTCMDLLMQNGYIEWQGTLRDTYNYYLRDEALEKNNPEMWALLPKMVNAFQYDTRAGKEALNKIGATNIVELTLANGLMRLAVPNGEQPMDMYVRYRNDINEWYRDMTAYGIPQEEQDILKELLASYSGMMIAQATMMSVLMDKRVCGFTLKEADRARKAVSKKDPVALAETEQRLYQKGAECGRSKAFLDYLWNVQIEMSKSYAFDFSHSHEYSTECLQELNLYWKYPKIFWNASVVITQSQTEDERENTANSMDYGKIAQSIYKAKENNITVAPPSIQKSTASFTVDVENDSILFGLACIAGINQDITSQIIQNRPYTSFQDFYTKNAYDGSLITRMKFVQLIKAGCFDEFEPNRIKVVKQFVVLSTPKQTKFTMANLPKAIEMKVPIPRHLLSPYNFFKYIRSPKFFYSVHPNFKSKKIYRLDDRALQYFNKNCKAQLQEGIDWFVEDDMTLVVDKSIEKLLKPTISELQSYIATEQFAKDYNRQLYRHIYNELVPNQDVNHWSLETCSFYSHEHELANIDRERYNISLFDELPEEPVFVTKRYGKREWKQYELSRIAGVVLDRTDSHHTITLLDMNNNVVQCKFVAENYAFFKQQISIEEGDKKKVVDSSWFKRGQPLILTGVRIGENEFRVKTYKSSIFQHKVQKIVGIDNETGEIEVQSYRYGYGYGDEED